MADRQEFDLTGEKGAKLFLFVGLKPPEEEEDPNISVVRADSLDEAEQKFLKCNGGRPGWSLEKLEDKEGADITVYEIKT